MNLRITVLLVLFLPIISVAQKRAFEIEDLYKLKYISDPQLSPNENFLAYTLASYDLPKGKSNTDIYLMNLSNKSIKQLTHFKGADYNPRFSPDGKWLAFISTRSGESQIYLLPLNGGESKKITSVSTGIGEITWSPDSRFIAFSTTVFPACGSNDDCNKKINDSMSDGVIQAHMADELLYRHWTEYSDGKRSHIFSVNVESNEIKDLTPGDFDSPIFSLGGSTNFTFSPDGKELCFASNRDKSTSVSQATTTNSDLWILTSDSGDAINITPLNKAWDGSPKYSPDGKFIAYRTQSTPGYESDLIQLALYNRAAKKTEIVSVGFDNWINDFEWSEDSRLIYFTCEEKGGTPLYSINLTNKKIAKVLDANAIDAFTVSSINKAVFLVRRSTSEPSALFSFDLNGKKLNRLTFDNQSFENEIDIRPAEAYWTESKDGTKIHYFVVKPHNFNRAKKYPVILNVHGGPQSQWMDAFRGDWQVYPGKGYIVVFPNPRGSTGYGQKFTSEISKDWGGKVYEDLMAVMNEVEKLPFVDKDRIGAMGWSYGGYMMNWFQAKTKRFKCLVSMMGVYDLRSMYSSTEELWFPEWDLGGTPWDSKDIYDKWSPSNYVKNFSTPTLVITGKLDFRVPYSQSVEYFTDLQKMGVDSRLIIFKNDGHWPSFVKSMPLYYNAHLDWFSKYLGGEKAPWNMNKIIRNQIFE
ncbi:MAG: S9 family peptidase [Ignavibacteria bacterium]|nr:S9 family peptidase [Ignavibacteria bacterium]